MTAAQIVDAFEPDHMGEAGKPEHVTVEPVDRGLARGRGEDYRVDHAVAADRLVDHAYLVAIGVVQPARQHV